MKIAAEKLREAAKRIEEIQDSMDDSDPQISKALLAVAHALDMLAHELLELQTASILRREVLKREKGSAPPR